MDSNEIKQLIETLLKHMHIACERIDVSDSNGREGFSIKTPDSHVLIGAKGANLLALNHLVKKIVAAKSERARLADPHSAESSGEARASDRTPPEALATERAAQEKSFFVDVNGYQEAAVENIKTIAKIMGDRARSFKTNVELDPMSSYERMVIHSFFQEAKDIKTESIGEGERRRVVVKYVEQADSALNNA